MPLCQARKGISVSLHHGKIAGGGKANKTKSLTTRSGSTVTLDDEKGSVTVSDPSGNVIVLQGNGQILIHAPNAITFSSKDIHLHASNSLNLNAVPSKQGGEGTIALQAKKSISSMAEDEGISLSAKQNVDLISREADVSLQAKVKVDINSTCDGGFNLERKDSQYRPCGYYSRKLFPCCPVIFNHQIPLIFLPLPDQRRSISLSQTHLLNLPLIYQRQVLAGACNPDEPELRRNEPPATLS